MNQRKLKEYRFKGSIHTIALKSEGILDILDQNLEKCIVARSQSGEKRTTTSIINPNKLAGDLFSYSDFKLVMECILKDAGINEYVIVRADMRFDSYDPEHYQLYAKLNRYLISALAVTYTVRNCYRTTNLFSQKQLSVAIKNKYFECENYDKNAESAGKDMAMSRLEERSKCWKHNDLRAEFTDHWFSRWDKAIKNLDAVHKRYNDELEQIYKEDRKAYPCQFRTLTDFLIQYQECIFCKKQMINLLARFEEVGVDQAKTRAENHKKRYGIEYFSVKDVEFAIGEIKRATLDFFEN